MTKLPADLEALMPKPAVRCGDYAGPPGEGASEDYYDADQVREAMLAATERAAKICDADAADTRNRVASGDWHAASGDYYVEGCLDGAGSCAAAIRGEK